MMLRESADYLEDSAFSVSKCFPSAQLLDYCMHKYKYFAPYFTSIDMQQLQANTYTEQRECMRLKHVSFVVVLDCKTGKSYLGELHNYNRLGIYFELEAALNPGSEIRILIDDSPYITTPVSINAEVIWCNDLNGSEELFRYGIGVKYNQEVNC